jgi:hypothetical protein
LKITYHCIENDDDLMNVWDDGVNTFVEIVATDPDTSAYVTLDKTGLTALHAHLSAVLGRVADGHRI